MADDKHKEPNLRRLKCVTCGVDKEIKYFYDIWSLYEGNRECITCCPSWRPGPEASELETEEEEKDLRNPSIREILE